MSAGELLHRLTEQAGLRHLQRDALRLRRQRYDHQQYRFCTSLQPLLPALPLASPSVEADQLLTGNWPALGYPWQFIDSPRLWLQAPDSDREWPNQAFQKINYREDNPFGDARVAWEPARLQQLFAIAREAQRQPAPVQGRLLQLFADTFDSWISQNPPYQGVHYVSAMECALRLIAVCHAFDLLRGLAGGHRQSIQQLPGMVHAHARLISQRLSLYSSAGNHTIAEAAGLIYAGTLFPEFDESKSWLKVGTELISREAHRQILADGGGIEQAFWYHLFVVDLCGLCRLLLDHYDFKVPGSLSSATDRGVAFLNQIATSAKTVPRTGDADDGHALSADLMLSWQPDTVGDSHRCDHRLSLNTFSATGYSLIKLHQQSTGSADNTVKVLFDHGPLGMPPNAGHGHADALSVQLSIGGSALLIDPGTGSYNSGHSGLPPTGNEHSWRHYFRSTAAHNTLNIGGEDQTRQLGNFLWSQNFNAQLVEQHRDQQQVALLACHDGYQRHGVRHWRGICLTIAGQLLIWDQLQGSLAGPARLHWHLGGRVEQTSAGWRLEANGFGLEIRATGGEARLYSANATSPLGWRSPGYGELQAGQTLIVEQADTDTPEWITETSCFGPEAVPDRQIPFDYSGWIRTWKQTISTFSAPPC